MGPSHRHATAACDRRGSRRRISALFALLLTLSLTATAAPSQEREAAAVNVTIPIAAMPSGSVRLDPPGQRFGEEIGVCAHDDPDGECEVTYSVEPGAPLALKLTAVPGLTQSFVRWSAPECGTGPVCTIQLTAGVEPPQVWAVFSPAAFEVLIEGDGTVTGANGTIDCRSVEPAQPGPKCSDSATVGTPLTLTAVGAGGASVKWVFGCDPGENPNASTCVLLPENRFVGVSFDDAGPPSPPFNVSVSLRVVKSGSGSGSVTGAATDGIGGPINCGATCVAKPAVIYGSRVRLTAVEADGSHFVRWTGAPCSTQKTCVLNAGPITTVGAVFDENARPAPPSPPPTTTGTTTAPGTTTTGPSTPPRARPKLRARLLGVSWRRVDGRRRLLARVEMSKLVNARLRVLRGTRILGQRTVELRPGRATPWVALARSTRAGPGVLQIRFSDRDGQVVTVRRQVVVGL